MCAGKAEARRIRHTNQLQHYLLDRRAAKSTISPEYERADRDQLLPVQSTEGTECPGHQVDQQLEPGHHTAADPEYHRHAVAVSPETPTSEQRRIVPVDHSLQLR